MEIDTDLTVTVTSANNIDILSFWPTVEVIYLFSQDASDEILFEEYGFKALCRTTGKLE